MDMKKIYFLTDSLKGNVSRMCVCEDFQELVSMREWAIKRINAIYSLNEERLKQEGRQAP